MAYDSVCHRCWSRQQHATSTRTVLIPVERRVGCIFIRKMSSQGSQSFTSQFLGFLAQGPRGGQVEDRRRKPSPLTPANGSAGKAPAQPSPKTTPVPVPVPAEPQQPAPAEPAMAEEPPAAVEQAAAASGGNRFGWTPPPGKRPTPHFFECVGENARPPALGPRAGPCALSEARGARRCVESSRAPAAPGREPVERRRAPVIHPAPPSCDSPSSVSQRSPRPRALPRPRQARAAGSPPPPPSRAARAWHTHPRRRPKEEGGSRPGRSRRLPTAPKLWSRPPRLRRRLSRCSPRSSCGPRRCTRLRSGRPSCGARRRRGRTRLRGSLRPGLRLRLPQRFVVLLLPCFIWPVCKTPSFR